MFFDFGDRKVAVSFGHSSQVVKGGQFKGRAKVTTWCKIKDVTDDVPWTWVGTSVQNPMDVNNKYYARKLAFDRAMNMALQDTSFTKEERTALWNGVSDFIGIPNTSEMVRE